MYENTSIYVKKIKTPPPPHSHIPIRITSPYFHMHFDLVFFKHISGQGSKKEYARTFLVTHIHLPWSFFLSFSPRCIHLPHFLA